jgi:lipopolysaccharide biosynthesis regulator YciM
MDFDFSWLLALPLFFGLGWWAARHERKRDERDPELPSAYFRGLNFLLNEQPDQAIDAFIDVVRLDPETVDLHFALGNLFRRRGETDRAIRVHQSLVDRTDLPARLRERALFELGQDFLKAGLLDRAEAVFAGLNDGAYAAEALGARLEIAQMVRDWPQAIELAAQARQTASLQATERVAHFHCELAERVMAGAGDPERMAQARLQLDAAAQVVPGHPRIAMLRARLAVTAGHTEQALDIWSTLFRTQPAFVSLVAEDWMSAHRALGRASEGMAALEAVYGEHPSIDLFCALVSARLDLDGAAATLTWAHQALRDAPSLVGLERLLELRALEADTTAREELQLIGHLVHAQAQRLSRRICGHCGFKARQHYWQCPGCNRWDTYAPQRIEDLGRG